MKKRVFLSAAVMMGMFSFSLTAEETTEQFLNTVRNFRSMGTYSKLKGTIQHRRRGKSVDNTSIYFGIIIQNDRFTGNLVIGGKDSFLISQSKCFLNQLITTS